MPGASVLIGVDELPRGVALDDPRLPLVPLDAAKLRLNTVPVPPSILAGPGHAARVEALTAWLLGQAGTWAAGRRRRIADYLAAAASEIERNRDEIAASLARYDGLYTPDDRFWSALRPLPRAWVLRPGEQPRFVDLGFWDGQVLHTDPAATLRSFWRDPALPSSPFRRLLVAPEKA